MTAMRIILIGISIIGLILTIVPSVLVFTDHISMDFHKQLMVVGMILWFTTAAIWMKEDDL